MTGSELTSNFLNYVFDWVVCEQAFATMEVSKSFSTKGFHRLWIHTCLEDFLVHELGLCRMEGLITS
jgi:hypothetical protein